MSRAALAALAQMMLMAAIVATLLYWPIGIAAALGLSFFNVSPDGLLTFGGLVGMFAGMVVWWLVAFAGALAYAAFVFPWDVTQDFGGR